MAATQLGGLGWQPPRKGGGGARRGHTPAGCMQDGQPIRWLLPTTAGQFTALPLRSTLQPAWVEALQWRYDRNV